MENLKLETRQLLKRMQDCSMLPYRWNEPKILDCIKKIWDLTGTPQPKEIVFCKDIFDERFASARASARASAIASASASASARAIARASASASASASARAIARASAIAIASASASAIAGAIASARASASDYDFDWFCGEVEMENGNKKYIEIMEILLQAKEAGLGYLIDDNINILYIAPNPVVKITNNQFHSDQFPAIEYATQSFYFLNGVKFPKALWKKVVSKEMPFEEILAIEDIDQRTQAMRYGNVNKFFEHTKAKLLDKSERGNELYKIPVEPSKIFNEDAYYLKYKCPSTGREYMSGVPKEIGEKKNADEAMSWKHYLPLETYKWMQPLKDES